MKRQQFLHQIPRIADGIDYLLANDPVFRDQKISVESFTWPYMGPGFEGLVRIVVGQQLSMKAAQSIWNKFYKDMPCVTPNAIMALKDDEMRRYGLSYQKAKYIRGLAEAVRQKTFDPEALEDLDDEAVYQAITDLKGFGDWSAEMFLMFGLARPDIWPAGDLGVQEGLRIYLNKKERPSADDTKKEGKRFAPYRTAAALLLWQVKAQSDK